MIVLIEVMMMRNVYRDAPAELDSPATINAAYIESIVEAKIKGAGCQINMAGGDNGSYHYVKETREEIKEKIKNAAWKQHYINLRQYGE